MSFRSSDEEEIVLAFKKYVYIQLCEQMIDVNRTVLLETVPMRAKLCYFGILDTIWLYKQLISFWFKILPTIYLFTNHIYSVYISINRIWP